MEKIFEKIKKKEHQIKTTEKRLAKQKEQLKALKQQKKEREMKELFSVIEDKGMSIEEAVKFLQKTNTQQQPGGDYEIEREV